MSEIQGTTHLTHRSFLSKCMVLPKIKPPLTPQKSTKTMITCEKIIERK